MITKNNTIEFAYTPVNGDNTKLEQEDGWYHVILGGFNILNKDNIYYDLEGVQSMLEDPNHLICQRLKAGSLYGEMGHPIITPGMTGDQIISNNLKISDERVSHVIRKLEFIPVDNKQKMNPFNSTIYVVTAWIKPTGPCGHLLKESLDDPYQNTSFSIRSLVRNELGTNGYTVRKMLVLITWDWVREPGIRIADKNNAVSFKGKNFNNGKDLEVCHIDMDELKHYVSNILKSGNVQVMGNESLDTYRAQVECVYNKYDNTQNSIFLRW